MSEAPADAPVSLVKDGSDGREGYAGSLPTAVASTPVEGYLAIAVRVPVRIVTLLLILPVRMVWDVLTVCGRALKRTVWVPFARLMGRLWRVVLAPVLFALFVWPWLALWRYVLAPLGRGIGAAARAVGAALAWLGRTLVLAPLTWIHARLLTPLGHGLLAALRGAAGGLAWLGRYLLVIPGRALGAAVLAVAGLLLVAPAVGLYRYVLTPLGHALVAGARGVGAGLAWLWRYSVVVPCVFVHRWVLAPAGRVVAVIAREIADALGHAWRVAGYVSRAVFRFLAALLRLLIADPAVWVWINIARPLGQGVRDVLWRPTARVVREAGHSVRAAFAAARASVRETRAELRRALFGAPSVTERKPLPENGAYPGSQDHRTTARRHRTHSGRSATMRTSEPFENV